MTMMEQRREHGDARLRPVRKRPLAALLVERGIFADADEARRWVMAGQVLVDEQRVDKPGTPVAGDAAVRVLGRRRYASRGGYKLAAALDHFGVAVTGRVALDCGASAGGFTDCLIQHGARLVYAVEAGYGQLLGRLRADRRVRNLERTNLGDLTPTALDPLPTLITLDLSYLSLTQALPQAATLLAPKGEILALLKPLFEVEDAVARRTGQVDDPALLVAALRRVLEAAAPAGLTPLGAAKLALPPRHGVVEFFLHFVAAGPRSHDSDIAARRRSHIPWDYDQTTLAAIVAGAGIGSEAEICE
jgi:23S rRNA (cytidine1920-2'-O)/16S rRNA (cytidine1409-2'-O)-methyltransferase